MPKGRKVTVSAGDIAPTPAGPEVNESQSLSQSNGIPFITLEKTDSSLHDLARTNDLCDQPDLQIGTPVTKNNSLINYSTSSLTVLLSVYFLSPTYFRICFSQ